MMKHKKFDGIWQITQTRIDKSLIINLLLDFSI